VIPPPSEGGGVVPEWSVNISDRSGFIERKNHLSWYLPLMWKNNHLMLEPGTTEPAFSYSIFGGRVRVRYLVVEEASNSMAIQTDLIYVSNGRNPVEAAKSIIINVKIEPKQ
jgi:hypothetical protein